LIALIRHFGHLCDETIDKVETLVTVLESAQRIIERDFPNGQLAIDIKAALSAITSVQGI